MNKSYLIHYGIKGQRWGIRRFQNEDGSLKNKAKNKFNTGDPKQKKVVSPEAKKARTKKGLKIAGTILGIVGTYVAADYVSSKILGEKTIFEVGKMAVTGMKILSSLPKTAY